MTGNRARLIAAALAILLWVMYAAILRADGAIVHVMPTSLSEMTVKVLRGWSAETESMCWHVSASHIGSETVVLASEADCIVVPESSTGLMLAIGCLWMVLLRGRSAKRPQDPYVLAPSGSNLIG